MPQITEAITPRAFEFIGRRISEILADELPGQATLSSDPEINVPVFWERFVPFKDTEVPAVNVMLSRSEFGSLKPASQDGVYSFNVDIYAKSKSGAAGDRGDTLAMIKLQKIAGKCHGILSHQAYMTLGFERPFIGSRSVSDIRIAQPENVMDASSVVMARLVIVVSAPNQNVLVAPPLIDGYSTSVKLSLTEEGYVYTGSPGDTPIYPPLCAPAIVTNSTGEVVEVASGDSFECTPVAPATYQNSDGTFSGSVSPGGNLPLPDISVLLGDGTQTFPSVKDISLPDYFQLIMPSGTRIPVNTASDPSTQTAWFNNTANVVTGDGYVEKTEQGGFNARVNFMIPTIKDFELSFQLIGSDVFAGLSYIDVTPSYQDIGFAISVSGSSYYIYRSGVFVISFGGYSPSDVQKIVRSNGAIKYYVNDVLKFTDSLISSDFYASGYMLFDCSLFNISTRVEDILLTYL